MNYQPNSYSRRYKTYSMYVFAFLYCISSAFAQDAAISRIDANYLSVKEAQAQEKLFICDFRYQPGVLKFPNVVEYKRQEKFYYTFDDNSQPLLAMVVLQIDSGKIHYDIELVFNSEGSLVFCRENQNNPVFQYNQISIYFKEEELLRFMEGNAIVTSSLVFHKEKIEFIQKKAKILYKKFLDYSQSLPIKP